MQEGIVKDKEDGIAIGAASAKHSMARQMLQEGESIERVARWTGLSEETIRSL